MGHPRPLLAEGLELPTGASHRPHGPDPSHMTNSGNGNPLGSHRSFDGVASVDVPLVYQEGGVTEVFWEFFVARLLTEELAVEDVLLPKDWSN